MNSGTCSQISSSCICKGNPQYLQKYQQHMISCCRVWNSNPGHIGGKQISTQSQHSEHTIGYKSLYSSIILQSLSALGNTKYHRIRYIHFKVKQNKNESKD